VNAVRARGILLALVVALVVGGAAFARTRPIPSVAAGTDDIGVPGTATRSAAWFCAAGTASPGGSADETIVITNAAPVPVLTRVTVMPAPRQTPVVRDYTVGARAQQALRVADIVTAVDPGVVVESFGGDVGVEHVLTSGHDFAVGPCARRAARRWQFAAGSTARDAREVISVFNPFGDDAVISVVFATNEGFKRPPALRSVVVPARSRTSIAVGDSVSRQENVSADVTVQRGRVVAERTLSYDGSAGRSGFTTALGSAPSAHVAFAEGNVIDGVTENLVLFNPEDQDASASVAVHLDNGQKLEPQDVAVPGRSTAIVDLGVLVPKAVGHAVDVSVSDGRVVVEQTTVARSPAARIGAETVPGMADAARRWFFAYGEADAAGDEWLSVYNPGSRRATFTVAVFAGGRLLIPDGLEAVTVPAGHRRVLRLGDSLQRHDTPLTVSADRPVYVERGEYATGFSLTAGLPYDTGS